MTSSPPEPGRIARLPKDKHGRPVPWFVASVRGVPDFRLTRGDAAEVATARKLCWVCGIALARQEPRAFVIGPMCVVNLNTAEPPCHAECAAYSATACPFLTRPSMTRRDRHLPPGTSLPPGEMIMRNPGVTCVYAVKYNAVRSVAVTGGSLFRLPPIPLWADWYAHGRPATQSEAHASIVSGLPALVEKCAGDPAGLAVIDQAYQRTLSLLPAAPVPA